MKLNTFLRWSVLVGIFAVLLVPLVMSTSLFFPFISGKNFMFRILVELSAGLWIILALRDSLYRPKVSAILKSFLVLIVLIFISDLLSPNPLKSFWSNYERMECFVTLAHLFVFFLVSSSVIDTQKLWTRFFQSSIGVSLNTGVYGILQLTGKVGINQGGVRLDSTFGNATYFSVYMMFHVFFTLTLFLRSHMSRTMQWVYGLIILFQL